MVQRILHVTIVGMTLALAAPAAPAQTTGVADPTVCKQVNGQTACRQVTRSKAAPGSHAYERWSDGSPATGEASSATQTPRPPARYGRYIGGYNAGYGLGR
jgi:hypothetical protein